MRIIVGITGASGSIYGIRLLQVLHDRPDVETHLVMSEAARRTVDLETDFTVSQIESLADYVYDIDDVGASIASGSFRTEGMIVAPCSIKSLSAIATSFSYNLLIRAADVALKERRKLVLLVRETPLHSGHLKLMMELSQCGAIILPPIPAFYHHPKTIDDVVDQTIGKALDLFGLDHNLFQRWGEEADA
ncbi:MAG: UbiX family flavin prenyltransferase [Chloroflexi bacterium]|nr:UbiX family flavin prenyltransferase [Chloroflexota bacterium]